MRAVSVELTVPEGMAAYLTGQTASEALVRNAMMLYPLVRDLTISYGRAAEMLGVRKTDLIELYDSLGIPYLDQSREELLADLATLGQVGDGQGERLCQRGACEGLGKCKPPAASRTYGSSRPCSRARRS